MTDWRSGSDRRWLIWAWGRRGPNWAYLFPAPMFSDFMVVTWNWTWREYLHQETGQMLQIRSLTPLNPVMTFIRTALPKIKQGVNGRARIWNQFCIYIYIFSVILNHFTKWSVSLWYLLNIFSSYEVLHLVLWRKYCVFFQSLCLLSRPNPKLGTHLRTSSWLSCSLARSAGRGDCWPVLNSWP